MSYRPIRSFRDLEVWQAAMDLAVSTYDLAARLPTSEKFELSAQARRAAASVPSNIAEGHALRKSRKTYLRHVRIALGSMAELTRVIELAERLHMVRPMDVESIVKETCRTRQLLHGLARALDRQHLKTAVAWLALFACVSLYGLSLF